MRELDVVEIDQISGGWGKLVGEIVGAFAVGLGGAIAKDRYDESKEEDNDSGSDSGSDSGGDSGGGS